MVFGAASYLTAVATATNTIVLIIECADGTIYWTKTTNGGTSWTTWANISGGAVGPITAVSASANTIDLFVQGDSNHHVYWNHYDGSAWGSFTAALGGTNPTLSATGSIAVSTPGGGVVNVVVANSSAVPVWNYYNGSSWSGWASLGGIAATGTSPACVSISSSEVWAFIIGTNGAIYANHYSSATWGGWANKGASAMGSTPFASYDGTNVYVFSSDTSNYLYYLQYASGSWGSATRLANGTSTIPIGCPRGTGVTDVVTIGASNGNLYALENSDPDWAGGLSSDWITVSATYLPLAVVGGLSVTTVSGSTRVDAFWIDATYGNIWQSYTTDGSAWSAPAIIPITVNMSCPGTSSGSNKPTPQVGPTMPVPGTSSASSVPIPQVTKPLTTVPTTSSGSNVPVPQVTKPLTVVPSTSSGANVPTPKVTPGVLTCPGTSSGTGAVLPKVTKVITTVPDATAAAGIVTARPSIIIYPSVVPSEAATLAPARLHIDALITTVVIGAEAYVLTPEDIVIWDGSFQPDLTIDEATDIKIYGVAKNPDGSPYNLATATIEWNMRDHNGDILALKSTADGSIIIDSPELGMFHFSLTHVDTDWDLEPTIKNPVVARHEARVINGAEQFVGLRGKVFIMPSQTEGS